MSSSILAAASSSSDNVGAKQIVETFLNGIGLGHAIPSFTKAGIVTPSALAELNIHHYEALGVVDPEDRRKLFFLVERIKLSVPQMVEEQHDQEQQLQQQQHHDKELNKIMSSQGASSSSSSPTKHPAPRPDPMEDGEDRRHRDVASQPNGKHQQQQQQRVARLERGSRKITASPRRTRSMTSQQQTSQTSLRLTNNINNDDDEQEDDNEHEDDENEDENVENRERDENENEEEDEEEESVGADDEASSRHRFGVRTHRRAMRHRSPIKESVSTALSSTTTTKMTTPENKSSLRKHSTLADTVTTRRRPTSMGPQDTTTTTTSNDANIDSMMKPGARKSKMQPPRTRRSDIKPSSLISMTRTGKQLSCIPADSIAPASPLVTLPLARLDADIEAQQRIEDQHYKGGVTRKTGASRRSRPLSMMVESGSSESEGRRRQRRQSSNASDSEHTHEESSNSESRQTRRISNSSKSLDGSSQLLFNNNNNNNSMEYSARGAKSRPAAASNTMLTTGRSTSLRDLNTTTSGVAKPSNRRSLPGNRHHVVIDNKLTPTASSASGLLFHGAATANSWASQVAKLRDDNQTEYDLFHADGSSSSGDDESMRIRVVIRKRPMSRTESMAAGEMDIIHPLSYHRYGKILVYQPKTRLDLTKEVETAQFAFDNVFDETSTNAQIYQRAVSKLIPGVIQGGQQVSVFAYGQTGSGKSFTMLGSNLTGIVAGTSNDKNAGLYYLAAVDLFQLLPSKQMSVTVSLFEIYGKKLFDLLGDRAVVKCLEDGAGKIQFKGLTEHVIQNAEELLKLIELGAKHRSTGSTSRNADSSRSHAVLQIHLRKHHQQQHHHYGGSSSNGARHYHGGQHGRLTFIDLAGSERGSDTSSASHATRIESSDINSSLLCLKEVIRALATGDHIPFRGCKLTQVLKDSFVGPNSRCVMLGCISPNQSNCDHSLNTLHYCNRLKERNSETGALPLRPALGHKQGSVTRRKFSATETGYEAEASSALDETDDDRQRRTNTQPNSLSDDDSALDELLVDDYTSVDGNDSAILDNLLASSSVRSSNGSPETRLASVPSGRSVQQTRTIFNKQRGDLIATHNAVLSALLAIVKEEMELANELGADRDGLEEHLSAIDSIQARKIELISKLNKSLVEYRCSSGEHAVLSDDSFEDLRD